MGLTFVPVDYLVAKVVDREKNNHNNVQYLLEMEFAHVHHAFKLIKDLKINFCRFQKKRKGKIFVAIKIIKF